MTTMDTRGNIVILKDDNYVTWKYQVRMLLMRDDLYDIVTGDEGPPEGEAAATSFRKRKQKALSTIALSIDASLMHLVGEATDPVELWKKLQAHFQRPTWANNLRIQKKIYNLKLGPTDKVQDHLKTLSELFEELAVIGEPMKEENKVIILLASLPARFSPLVTALEALDTVPRWDSVSQKLLHHEQKNEESVVDNSVSALASSTKTHPFKKQVRWYNCGKVGHISKHCSSKKQGKQAVVAADTTGGVTLVASASAMASTTETGSRWLIDSGASQHMVGDSNADICVNRVELGAPVEVKLGNNSKLFGKSICDVDINVIVNNEISPCRIKNVLVVPGLAFNLLSVAQLSRSSKTVVFHDKHVEILKDNRVVATGTGKGDLYFLDCHDKNEIDTVCNVATSSDEKQCLLWHRRFAHASNISMSHLNKVRGFNCKVVKNPHPCEHCCSGKQHQLPFNAAAGPRTQAPLELIHSDVCGPIKPCSQ